MVDFQSPEVRAREVRTQTPQVQGVPTAVAAFVGRTQKGPANKAIFVDSYQRFLRIFGDPVASSYLAETVELYFANGGGTAYVTRVLGSSGGTANAKATFAVQTAAPAACLSVTTVGEGVYGNAHKVVVAKTEEVLAPANFAITALLPIATLLRAPLTATAVKRVSVGDTIRFNDGTTTIRGIVARIENNDVVFETGITLGTAMTVALTTITLETFSLRVDANGATVAGPYSQLRMSPLSQRNYFATRINAGSDEDTVTVTDSAPTVGAISTDNRPTNTVAGGDLLAAGAEYTTAADADYVGSVASFTGLFSFDKIPEIRGVSVPGITGTVTGAVTKALLDYTTAREDCISALAPPAGQTPAQVLTFKNAVGGSSYQTWNYPWPLIISKQSGAKVATPPDGIVLGIYARTDRNRGVAKSPAGETDGRMFGTVGVERVLTVGEKDTLYPQNVNLIENIPGVGQCLMGSRTGANGEFQQIHKRRTFIYLERSVVTSTRWVLFENNTEATRARVRRSVEAFLSAEHLRGTLEGATAEEAYRVVCDESNNPPETRAQNKLFCSVAVRIADTIEFATFDFSQQTAG